MSSNHKSSVPMAVRLSVFAFVLLFAALIVQIVWLEPRNEDPLDVAEPATETYPVVAMELESGTVMIRMRPDLAPNHVEQIRTLVDDGFYDGLLFHRVIDGFMAQTGDPTGTGSGRSHLPNVAAEFTDEASFERGTVGMARSSSPDSANSQFFIMFAPAPHLNGQYTIIGEVIDGMEFVDAIKKGASRSGLVTDPDQIVRMSWVDETH